MAVVSRPIKTSRRIARFGGVRQALSSWWMAALAYMLLLVLGYLMLTPVFVWGQQRLDDLRYGFPRATQLDAYVGHGEAGVAPTHLIALNLRGQISILELPGGDGDNVRVIPGPYLVGADSQYAVPFLSTEDVTGDGAPDLLLQVREEVVIYVNEDGAFRLITPAERAQLVQPGGREAR